MPDGLIEVFFKPPFVLDTVGDLPELFVQQLPEHHTFLCVLLIADIALVLEAAFFGRWGEDKGYICYEEDAQESVVLRELLDKKLWNIPDRIKDKAQFEENLNQSIRQYNPEYWRARQSGRKAAEVARSTTPAKEAAR